MASASGVTFELKVNDIAYFQDAVEYAKMGLVPAGTYKNRGYSVGKVEAQGIEEFYLDLLYDPQTSGGLLLSVAKEDLGTLLSELKASGIDTAVSVIGSVAPESDKLIRLLK